MIVVEVTAAPEVLAARLAGRGRETGDALRSRLFRSVTSDLGGIDLRRLDNSGERSIAGEALAGIIREAMGRCRAG